MRATRPVAATLATLAAATPAIAATGRHDTSGIFVWVFLGLCAAIVAAQVVPAILMLFGAAKGVAKAVHGAEPKAVESEAEAR